jgi:chromosome segregation ATPase
MSDKITAAESIRRIANFILPMQAAAEALESMGKIEQTIAELERAQANAYAQRDEAVAEMQTAKAQIRAAEEKAVAIVAKANDQAMATLGEAERKAQAVLDAAGANASAIMNRANAHAEKATATLAGQVGQLTSAKVGLEQDLAGLNQAAAVKRAEVDALEAKLHKAQAQIAKLLA